MHGRKHWAWIVLGLMFGCPCLLTGVALMVLKMGFSSAGDRLPTEVAAARKAGLATDPTELRAMLAIPENSNAAGDYRAAMSAYDAEKPKKIDSMTLSRFLARTASPAEEKSVRDLLSQTNPAILLFEKAAAKQSVNWNRPWEQGVDLLFPELAQMKNAAKLISAKAILAAKAGNSGEALRLLALVFKMGAHAGQDPTVIGMLVQVALDSIASAATCQVLTIVHDRAALDGARRMMEALSPLADYRYGFSGELVMQRIGIRNIVRYAEESSHTDAPAYTDFPENLLIRDAGFRRALEAKVVRNHVLTYLALQRSRGWKSSKAEWEKALHTIQADTSLENRIAQDFVFGNFQEAVTRALAYRRLLAAGIEVLTVRLKIGHLPAALPPLGPDGIDPFSEKPVRYKLMADGFKVYSVDADEVDDGGLSRLQDTKGKSKTHDIDRIFSVR